jgi:hypothetical protein
MLPKANRTTIASPGSCRMADRRALGSHSCVALSSRRRISLYHRPRNFATVARAAIPRAHSPRLIDAGGSQCDKLTLLGGMRSRGRYANKPMERKADRGDASDAIFRDPRLVDRVELARVRRRKACGVHSSFRHLHIRHSRLIRHSNFVIRALIHYPSGSSPIPRRGRATPPE